MCWRAASEGLRPDPHITVSQWADKHRMLARKSSAEPGPWRTDRTPYLREIMDCLSPRHPARRIVFRKGSQIGGTECGNNWLGHIMATSPGPIMLVQPTVLMAQRNAWQRIQPMIDECPALRGLVGSAYDRNATNTALAKEFPGGMMILTGANSATGLRSMAAKFLFLDEVDAYPVDVDGEGDPIDLAVVRSGWMSRRGSPLIFRLGRGTWRRHSALVNPAPPHSGTTRPSWYSCRVCHMAGAAKSPNNR